MSKIIRIFIFLLIFISISSCGLFKKENPEETESDDIPASVDFNFENNDETTTDNVVTEPEQIIQEPEQEIQNDFVGKNFSASGTIKSDTNHLLKLHIDWQAYQTDDNEYADLEITIYLDCYAILVGARTNSTLTIDGEKSEFSTPMITNDNNSLTSIEIYKTTLQILNPASDDIKSVDINSEFYFGGSYGGEAIGWIDVNGTIYLTDDGTPIPDIKIEEITEAETEKDPLVPELPDDPFEPVEE